MRTIAETRRERLEMLITQHGGKLANLNEALGYERNSTKLAKLRNANIRQDRGKPYQMGDALAREIEDALHLERGWMDTPPGYADLTDHRVAHAIKVLEAMPDYVLDQAIKIIDTLAEPPRSENGTTG